MARESIWEIFTGERYRVGGGGARAGKEPIVRRSCTATNAEWEHVEALAAEHGIGAAAYVRLLIMLDKNEGGLTVEKVKKRKVEQ